MNAALDNFDSVKHLLPRNPTKAYGRHVWGRIGLITPEKKPYQQTNCFIVVDRLEPSGILYGVVQQMQQLIHKDYRKRKSLRAVSSQSSNNNSVPLLKAFADMFSFIENNPSLVYSDMQGTTEMASVSLVHYQYDDEKRRAWLEMSLDGDLWREYVAAHPETSQYVSGDEHLALMREHVGRRRVGASSGNDRNVNGKSQKGKGKTCNVMLQVWLNDRREITALALPMRTSH